jgi:hypothetical protein
VVEPIAGVGAEVMEQQMFVEDTAMEVPEQLAA